MTRDEAKSYLKKNQNPDFLQKAKKKGYICPKCGNGSGTDGDGITREPGKAQYHCYVCGLHEDIIGLWKISQGITDDREAMESLYKYYNLIIEDEPKRRKETAAAPQDPEKGTEEDLEEVTSFTDFYLQAAEDIEKTDYHRGISLETLKKYKVGYVEKWRHPNTPNAPATPRLIIPITEYTYIARRTDGQTDYAKQKATGKRGARWIFNHKALKKAQKPIIITEGEIDALSIIDAGGEAVALGSIAYIRQFLEYLEEIKEELTQQPFILALDNDKRGQQAQQELLAAFRRLNIECIEADINGSYKDANDRLREDRQGLTDAVKKATMEALKITPAADYIDEFYNKIKENKERGYTPTNFKQLDNILDGGIHNELYIIGALSSLGKSTLVLQIADQLAQQGKDVFYYSLEMSKFELTSKSISRETYIEVTEAGGNPNYMRSQREITNGKNYEKYSAEELQIIANATENYKQYANHIYIFEGVGDIGAEDIKRDVTAYKNATGEAPIIIIDYLQILAPYDMRATDKQNTDKSVLELRRLCRDLKTAVIGISSFNRENYTNEVSMTSFKESGAIEYSSDVLIGLQPVGMKPGADNTEKKANRETIKNCRKADVKEMEIIILKNRNGESYRKINFTYHAKYNFFEENRPRVYTRR